MNPFKFNNSRGQSLLELAFIIPIFMAIVFGIIEFTNMYMTSLRASNLSRAIANGAFRDCGFLSQSSMSTCLQDSIDRVFSEANLILADFANQGTVMASTYEFDPNDPPARLAGQEAAGAGGYTSRYDLNLIDMDVLTTHERVVIGEVMYPYEPVTPVKAFLTMLNINPVIYEVTIY
jgi:hypothetical protein